MGRGHLFEPGQTVPAFKPLKASFTTPDKPPDVVAAHEQGAERTANVR